MFNLVKERICATIGRIAPKWCVENKYDVNQAYMWNLSSETEIEMINALGLDGDELRKREWLWKTRVWLINQGIFVCTPKLNTADEFEALLAKATMVPTDVFVDVLKRYTPNGAGLKMMLKEMDDFQLLKVAKSVPQAFNDIKLETLFDGFKDEDKDLSREVALMSILMEVNDKWLYPLIDYLTAISVKRLSAEAKELLNACFDKAILRKDNMSRYIVYLYENDSRRYNMVKGLSNQVVDDAIAMLRRLSGWPTALSVPEDEKAVYRREYNFWLAKLYAYAFGNDAYNAYCYLINNIKYIEQVCDSEQLLKNIRCHLIEKVNRSGDWNVLAKSLSDPDDVEKLRSKSVGVINSINDAKYFRSLFPFSDWKDEKIVAGICKKLIEYSVFPINEIDKLSSSLRDFVATELVTRSQKLYLEDCDVDKWTKLFEETRLQPDAECYMLSLSFRRCCEKLAYIKKYGLSEKAFMFLLRMSTTGESGYSYLVEYAKTKGLTNSEYAHIMQSQYADRAPFLSKYVKQ